MLIFVASAIQAAASLEFCNVSQRRVLVSRAATNLDKNPIYAALRNNTCAGQYAYACALGIVSALVAVRCRCLLLQVAKTNHAT